MSSTPTTVGTINGIKGDMTGIVGSSWTMTEELTTIAWDAAGDIDPDRIEAIRAALNEDTEGNDVVAGDPYFGGKQMAKLARLSLIADQLGETELAESFREKVRPTLEAWMDATNANKLLYDQSWGGIVSTNGINDEFADFGQVISTALFIAFKSCSCILHFRDTTMTTTFTMVTMSTLLQCSQSRIQIGVRLMQTR